MDADWDATPELKDLKVTKPVGFLAGKNDLVLKFFGSQDRFRTERRS